MTILIVEDHPVLRDKLAGHFSRAGFAADAVGGGADALAYLDRRNYDIMVLDLGLPGMDGMELLARRGGARCLILTARDALEDRLKGLDLGADDYVLKPFEMAELEARVRAVLRRADNAAAPVLRCGTLCFDTRSRHAAAGERPIQLSRREGMLLEELLRSSPRVVIKDVLEERLYSFEEEVTPNALEAVASRLRRKLRESGADCRMETVRGLGYRMSPASSEERAGRGRTGGRRI